jgi:hypothetical protein
LSTETVVLAARLADPSASRSRAGDTVEAVPPLARSARVNTATSAALSNAPGVYTFDVSPPGAGATMTKDEFISTIACKARLTPAAAARVADAIFDADDGAILEALRDSGSCEEVGHASSRPRRGDARKKTGFEGLTEAEIRAKLIEGFQKVQGMEIEDVYPGSWSDAVHP